MSRIGKMPIAVPAGVEITIASDNTVTVKGPKGTLTKKLHADMKIVKEEGQVTVERPSDVKEHREITIEKHFVFHKYQIHRVS